MSCHPATRSPEVPFSLEASIAWTERNGPGNARNEEDTSKREYDMNLKDVPELTKLGMAAVASSHEYAWNIRRSEAAPGTCHKSPRSKRREYRPPQVRPRLTPGDRHEDHQPT